MQRKGAGNLSDGQTGGAVKESADGAEEEDSKYYHLHCKSWNITGFCHFSHQFTHSEVP